MVSRMRVMVFTWMVLLVVLGIGQGWANPAITKQGFTPEASISISLGGSTFNAGESTTASISISGKTEGATIYASVSGPGVAQTSVDVSSGGGSVPVTLPTTAGEYTYTASATIGGKGVSDSTTITVTSNHAPVAINGTATTDEDTPCMITFQASDQDGDSLTFSPSNPYTYTPAPDFTGTDTISFTVDDGHGGITSGTVTVTVNPVNDAPEAYDGSIGTDEEKPVAISLSGFDVDGDTITPSIASGPSHGSLGPIDPVTHEVIYTSGPFTKDWDGKDSFTFKMNDGTLDSEAATVEITVKPVGKNITVSAGKYLLADGQDSCSVSVSVVDDQGNPKANTGVSLSTTGGTLASTTLTTDDYGNASTTLTSSTTSGDVTVTASMGDDDTDETTVTFFTFKLGVTGATIVPETTTYATGLGKEHDVVTATVTTTPEIALADPDAGLIWNGGTGTDNEKRTVAKDVAGQTSVSVTLRNSTQSANIVVLKVTGVSAVSNPLSIIEEPTYSPGVKHAVAPWTPTANTNATLEATVSPDVPVVYPLYKQFIVWSGGQEGSTPVQRNFSRNSPSRTEMSVTCGESKVPVIAWVAKVNIDIADIKDNEEDTKPAKIYINTDDDNHSATPMYNGSDLNETPVDGENDLVPITISVEPAGIGGQLSLSTSGDKIVIWQKSNKSGAAPVSWNLSTRLDDNTANDQTPPQQLWVEGKAISDQLGDQQITLTHTWGFESTDTVKATVDARPGESEATISVFSPATVNGLLVPGEEKHDPIGGTMYLGLQIKLGPGERLDPSVSTVTAKAQDDFAYDGDPAYATFTWNLSYGCQWYELINPGTTQAQWVQATSAPNNESGNRDGATTKEYCCVREWNTPFTPSLPFTPPMGHNGTHTIKIIQVNGVDTDQVSFQHYSVPQWQPAYQTSVPSKKVFVKNLVITNVSTSNGTEDYFKYDPDSDNPYYNRPTIKFTIEDDGDPHEYDAYILMWPTSVTGNLFQGLTSADAMAWTENCHLGTGDVSKTWDGALIPEGWAGHKPDKSVWSSYAFEICVFEYKDQYAYNDQYIDWSYLRWPYCLYLENHDVWVSSSENQEQLKCFYQLEDCAKIKGYSNHKKPSLIELQPLNEMLENLTSSVNGGAEIGYPYRGDDGNGIIMYTDDYVSNICRVVFTGEDECWVGYRRDHQPSRMLAWNAVPNKHVISLGDWLDMVKRLQTLYYQYKPTDSNCRDLDNRTDSVIILGCMRALSNRFNTNTGNATFGRQCVSFNQYVINVDRELSNWFGTDPNREFRDQIGKTVDIIHFVSVLGAMLYDTPETAHIGPAPVGLLTEQVIDEQSSWAGDLHSMIRDLRNEEIRLNIANDVQSNNVSQETLNRIATYLIGRNNTNFSMTDAVSDADGWVIGTYFNSGRTGFSNERLYEMLYKYYKQGFYAKRFNKFIDSFGDDTDDDASSGLYDLDYVRFENCVDDETIPHIYYHLVATNGSNVTEREMLALRSACKAFFKKLVMLE